MAGLFWASLFPITLANHNTDARAPTCPDVRENYVKTVVGATLDRKSEAFGSNP